MLRCQRTLNPNKWSLTDDGLVAAVAVEEARLDVHVEDGHGGGLREGRGVAEEVLGPGGHGGRAGGPWGRPGDGGWGGVGSNLRHHDDHDKQAECRDPPRHCQQGVVRPSVRPSL